MSTGSGELLSEVLGGMGVSAAVVRHRLLPAYASDIVQVVTEVDTGGWRRACPSAPVLKGELERCGVATRLVRAVTPGVAAGCLPNDSGDGGSQVVVVEPDVTELFRAAAETVSLVAFVCDDREPARHEMSAPVLAALRAWGAVGPRQVVLGASRVLRGSRASD
ncbi:hypothetical protein [Amycolatopsis sp. NPDC049868]|uniref:hypothetical protein n=1 Tax=Amycolatopsis sp. NPDC049868 TaxID=3363934 RepID=UPI0037948B17